MWNSPYAKYLLNVEKPGRYVGGEFGSVISTSAEVSIALAFPDVYEIGMSHLGLSILYEIVNSYEHLAAERVFMPWPDMVGVMKSNQLPLVSLESGRVLNDFDIVGFSLQYELTFTNVVAMLGMGRIPRYAEARGETDTIVVVGGPVAVEAEPMAPFVDLVLLGDGEASLPKVMNLVAEGKRAGRTRMQLIEEIDAQPFAYAPGLHERTWDELSQREVYSPTISSVRPDTILNLEEYPSGNGPVSTIQAVFDRYSVEIARGCTEGCRFCQAGYLYRPVRERSERAVAKILEKATCSLGFDEVSLSSLSSADHSEIERIMTGLGNEYIKKRVSFSVPSLRAYGLSDEVIAVLSKLRASGVTLAPEAGSQRLRDLVNKNVTEEDVLAAAARFFDRGFMRIKLYFMLGLPTETDGDLAAIIDLALKIRRIGQGKVGRRADVVVSVSTFVPKPLTPFELEGMIDAVEIRRRQSVLHDLARANRLKLKTHHAEMSVLEGVFARGDVRLSRLIEKAVDAGAMFDGWDELYDSTLWSNLLSEIDVPGYLAPIADDARVPWAHVDSGVSVEFRRKERDAALAHSTTPPCGVFQATDGDTRFVCHHCGIGCKKSQLAVKPIKTKVEIDPNAPRPPRPKGLPKPAKVIQAGDSATRYRIEVAFYGRQIYIGHLDRMRHIMRSLTRAGLQLWYTQGFHPKPKIEAPPPLPLGTAALAEPFDIWLVDAPSTEDILQRLRAAMPMDLEVRKVTALPPETKKLSHAFSAVEYTVLMKATRQTAVELVEELKNKPELEVVRSRKGVSKAVEIGQYIQDVSVIDDAGLQIPIADFSDRAALSMTLRLKGSGGTRPAEVIQALRPELDDIWVIRTRWWAAEAE